ncbi:MAG: DUF1573 domain-containing protein [Bacteroidales bacterium]|nr:DUF1573 domain-containing protein [Bacteroidales bacterium]
MGIVFFLMVNLLAVSVGAQDDKNAQLNLPVNTYDFGRIMEDGGTVTHRFEIVNSGSAPFNINNVRTTCGCTIPSWTVEAIPPGSTGYVEVVFDPAGRSGDFHKTIQIQSTASNANMFLSISGKVVPALKREELPHRFGDLAIKADQVNLGYLYKGATGEEYLTIQNMSDSGMRVSFRDVPDYIYLEVFPEELKPGQYGQIEVKYCTEKTDDWDVVLDQVTLLLNGEPVKQKELSIVANIREDFRNLTPEQRLAAPVAVFEHEEMSFDTISQQTPMSCRFELSNTGLSELKIRTVKASCGCTVARPEKNSLAPGESIFIEASFDPSGRSGDFKNGITVVTNDPVQYKKYLFVQGYIRQDN